MKKNAFVYFMTNRHKNVLYVGVTTNLPQRIYQHRNHLFKNSFTSRYGLEYLVYYELIGSIILAIEREKQLKGWSREKKNTLITSKNPDWNDLYDDVMEGVFTLLD